jgi:hypothetical protein
MPGTRSMCAGLANYTLAVMHGVKAFTFSLRVLQADIPTLAGYNLSL